MSLSGAILISGRGSNMEALLRAASDEPDHPVRFGRVIANRPDAAGLAIAETFGVETRVVPSKGRPKPEFEAELSDALAGIDLVCLAGFMRVLSPEMTEAWKGRMVNVHPSLLPKYPGLDTHRRVLEAGDAESGCTVHWVTAVVDDGPAIAQARVPVKPGDTPETLAARVLIAEHATYPSAVAKAARILLATREAAGPPSTATQGRPA